MFRPQRTTVLLAIVAEPAKQPDARFFALDCHSPATLLSQCISANSAALVIARSNAAFSILSRSFPLQPRLYPFGGRDFRAPEFQCERDVAQHRVGVVRSIHNDFVYPHARSS